MPIPTVALVLYPQFSIFHLAIPQSTQDAEINRLLDDLRENLDQQYSIEDLAKQLFMSRRTFTRHFNKSTGMSFGKWMVNARLQRSLELLENTTLSIDRVAEMVGFQTPTSFRQHFNQRFQVSPSAWRKTFGGRLTHTSSWRVLVLKSDILHF